MKKSTRNILIGSGIAALGVAVGGVISHAITKRLVVVAIERDGVKDIPVSGKAKNQLRGFEDTDEFIDELKKSAERLENRETQTVEITGQDGTRLVGHYYPCENAKRIIVAMHGWRSSWSKDFGMIADFWHDNHCSILFAEQRGQGNSGGEYMGFGLTERYDCLDWVNWVNETIGSELPIYLGGVSMGASTVLMAAGLDLPDNVKGIVADCGFTSPHAIWKHVAEDNLHLSYGIRGDIANELCKKKINIGSKEYSAADALRENNIPVLFIHGTDDHFVPVEMTYENYKACTAPKRLFIVPGADHGMSYFVNKAGYEKAIKDFWNDYDEMSPEEQ